MFIYQYLKIKNHEYISLLIKDYIENKTTILDEKLSWKYLDIDSLLSTIPELNIEFNKWNLKILVAAAVYRKPYSQWGIHIDSSNFYRVLWPVMNCQGSKTKFYKLEIEKFKPGQGKDGDRNLSLIPGNTLEFLDEFELNEPVIFNPQIPHGIFCNPKIPDPRVSLTLGFNRNPSFLIK
jgi:hypothetical protein